MRVLVTDGNERAALAVTRALGRQGLKVAVGAENENSLAAASKYCWHAFAYPSPYADEREFVSRLLEVVRRLKVGMVFPTSDIAMSLIGRHRREFEAHTILPIPATEAFESLSNKYRLMQLATRLEVPIPETVFVPDGCLAGVYGSLRHFPVVVKSGQSVVQINGHLRKTGVHYATSEAELDRLYDTIDYLRQPSLIQRRVEGEGQGIFALMNAGQPVALFAHRRLREKPPAGGVSVLRESIALSQPMTDYALRLLRHVGWHGVAMVEFKIDQQSGMPLLMEVNGRFWGSLQLAVDAGVNFPVLLCQLAGGQQIVPLTEKYHVGVKLRWLLGDLDHLLTRLLNSRERLHLPPDSPSRTRTLYEFFRFYQRGLRYEILRWSDPIPGVYEVKQYLINLIRIANKGISLVIRRLATLALIGPVRNLTISLHILRTKVFRWIAIRARNQGNTISVNRPRSVQNLLFVCNGNICRSPLAEAYVKSKIKDEDSIRVSSAGLETTLGKPAYSIAKEIARQYGLLLQGHRTTPINREMIQQADFIVVMEYSQRQRVLATFPEAEGKVFLLSSFRSGIVTQIPDPYGGTIERFDHCYELIRQSCDNLLAYISNAR